MILFTLANSIPSLSLQRENVKFQERPITISCGTCHHHQLWHVESPLHQIDPCETCSFSGSEGVLVPEGVLSSTHPLAAQGANKCSFVMCPKYAGGTKKLKVSPLGG